MCALLILFCDSEMQGTHSENFAASKLRVWTWVSQIIETLKDKHRLSLVISFSVLCLTHSLATQKGNCSVTDHLVGQNLFQMHKAYKRGQKRFPSCIGQLQMEG